MITKCSHCEREFNIKPSQMKRSKNCFCSKECHDSFRHQKNINELSKKVGEDFEKWLKIKYIDEQLSTSQISKLVYGRVNKNSILNYLRFFDIPIRNRSESVKLQWVDADKRRIEARKNLLNPEVREKIKETQRTEVYRNHMSETRKGKDNPYYVHGKTKTRLYNIWRGMKKRCYMPNNKDYKNYGQRGIKVCDEWTNSFISFYDWAMSNGYDDTLTIDRINNDGDYLPDNCKWSTAKEQRANQRKRRT